MQTGAPSPLVVLGDLDGSKADADRCALPIGGAKAQTPTPSLGCDVDVKGYDVDAKDCDVDVKGCYVGVKGCDVDVKGYDVDVKGCDVDAKGCDVD
eukprot:4839930-Pyramimonas_sp.AAC.1